MSDVDVDTSEIDEAIESVDRLGVLAETEYPLFVGDEVDNFVEAIRRWIGKKGLISHDGEGTPLVESFRVRPGGGNSWTVTSNAEHALPLEEGSQRHPITPNDANMLAWVPENPGDYPTRESQTPITMLENDELADGLTTWYDPEAGKVFSVGVTHPGNRPYEYIMTAQSNWQGQLGIKLDKKTSSIILRSGFNRL